MVGWLICRHLGVSASQVSPTAVPQDFVSLRSVNLLRTGQYGLAVATDFVSNSLPYYQTSPVEKQNDLVGRAHFVGAYGYSRNLTLEVAIPTIVYQSIKNKKAIHGEFSSYGMEAIELGVRSALLQARSYSLGLFVGGAKSLTSGFAKEAEMPEQVLQANLLGDYRWRSTRLTLNLGTIEKLGSSSSVSRFHYGAGLAYAIWSWKSEVTGEFLTSRPRSNRPSTSDRSAESSEMMFGLRRYISSDRTLLFSLGRELKHGVNTPDLRVLVGFTQIGSF